MPAPALGGDGAARFLVGQFFLCSAVLHLSWSAHAVILLRSSSPMCVPRFSVGRLGGCCFLVPEGHVPLYQGVHLRISDRGKGVAKSETFLPLVVQRLAGAPQSALEALAKSCSRSDVVHDHVEGFDTVG